MIQSFVSYNLPYNVAETSRTYTFPEDEQVSLFNVTEVIVQESGDHRVKTSDGHLHIIPEGWLHIDIEPAGNGWTF